jgi:hypothetical protein
MVALIPWDGKERRRSKRSKPEPSVEELAEQHRKAEEDQQRRNMEDDKYYWDANYGLI